MSLPNFKKIEDKAVGKSVRRQMEKRIDANIKGKVLDSMKERPGKSIMLPNGKIRIARNPNFHFDNSHINFQKRKDMSDKEKSSYQSRTGIGYDE